jgi:tetratricopeptide (TPR) repeat protein
LGALMERQGDLEKAKTTYETILTRLEHAPGQKLYTLTLNRLAMIYSSKGETDRALELFKTGVRMTQDNPHFYYQVAAVYAGLNDEPSAIRWLEEAVRRGFADWAQIEKDSRWAKIRGTLYYHQLRGQF